jgi:aminopeptidase N
MVGAALASTTLSGCQASEQEVDESDLTAVKFRGVKVTSADRDLPDVDTIGYDFDLDGTPTAAEDFHGVSQPDVAINLAGTLNATFVATRALDRFSLDYTGDGTIKGVRQGTAEAAFSRKPEALEIVLAKAVRKGESFTVSIELETAPKLIRNGYGEKDVRGYRKPSDVFENTHGLSYNTRHMLFTQHWPNRARQWFPCRDNPRDAAMFAVTLRLPSEKYTVVASGKRTEKSLANGKHETVHEMLHPIPTYAFFLGASKYWELKTSPLAGGGKLETYLADYQDQRERVFEDTSDEYAYFTKNLGPYVWETLRFVEVYAPGGAGMENVGAISIEPKQFENTGNPMTRGNARALQLHELAHQWAGNLVRIANWNDLWLSEGLATYLEFRYNADKGEASEPEHFNGGVLRPRELLNPNASSTDLTEAMYTATPYKKGAWVFRVLEKQVGRDVFLAFLKDWFAKRRFQAVDTETLKRDYEAFTGKDVSTLFQKAVYGSEDPE